MKRVTRAFYAGVFAVATYATICIIWPRPYQWLTAFVYGALVFGVVYVHGGLND